MPLLLVIYSVGIALLFAVTYLPSYRAATGEPARAEAILLFCGPILWTFTAVVAWWVIGRSYGLKPPSRSSS
jgi:uncharacterized protein YaaW (UPF0174 family)